MTYIIVDIATMTVTNSVHWDGVSDWTPPEGTAAIPYDGPAFIGGSWDGEKCSDPNAAPAPAGSSSELRVL